MSFDGTGDYLSIPDSSDWDLTGDFTIEFWFNLLRTTGDPEGFIMSGDDNWKLWYMSVGGNPKLHWEDDEGYINASTTALVAGQWYHTAIVRSGTTVTMYIDGASEGTRTTTGTISGTTLEIGRGIYSGTNYYIKGYMDEIRISDSARYTGTFTPQTRGNPFEADANTKLLIHSDYTGGLGADSSGNYNNFTATNLVATDQMIDTPTNNFCTLNPLDDNGITLSQGNLEALGATGPWSEVRSSMGVSSGKWYWEVLYVSTAELEGWVAGIRSSRGALFQAHWYSGSWSTATNGHCYGLLDSGTKVSDGSSTSSFTSALSANDIIGFALDLDSGTTTLDVYVNGSSAGTMYSGLQAGEFYTPAFSLADPNSSTSVGVMNLGSDSSFAGRKTAQGNQDGNSKGDFYYEPPSGYLAICTANLSTPEIKLPGEFHSTVLYTGDGNTTHAITGVGFSPAMNWVKARGFTKDHNLVDSVRGAHFRLIPNGTNAESEDDEKIVSLDSDGFTTGVDSATNDFTEPYVAWNWKAGTTNSGATSGSGTAKTYSSSTSATAGFSIIKYVGNGTSGHQIPHHMGVAPQCLIAKNLDRGSGAGSDWHVWHTGFGTQDKYIWLNQSNPAYASSNYFNAVSSTTFSLGTDTSVNADGEDIICYAFTGIENYSQFGSYEGNNNADGTFIYTGFEPAFLIYKNIDATADWGMVDNKRSPYNTLTKYLAANENAAEITNSFGDFTSNGIKMRNTYGGANAANTYIYLAFAESPFKYSNAR